MISLSRRAFLQSTGAAAAAAALPASARALGANERVRVGVMGVSRAYGNPKNPGRGSTLAHGVARLPGAEVAYVCDVDDHHLSACAAEVAALQPRKPEAVRDFRRILDDKTVDALLIATPDHLHTPAAVLACAAGKHVYVEKPCSHNPREGELLVEAARKHARVVQHGTQRRSWHREAIQALREGAIGRVLQAKCYYLFTDRPSIGRGKEVAPPAGLDWTLWQGPAPERPYRDNVVHYQWHWFWHWGTGELGNNGVHTIDVARWGLGVDLPARVTSAGGRLRYDDDQETPDTHLATFVFPNGTMIAWEGRSWGGKRPTDPQAQVVFYGDRGTLAISGGAYVIYDKGDVEVAKGSSKSGDAEHLQNWIDGIRGAAALHAEIEEGVKSTLLCHLGNIAWRTGKTLKPGPGGRVSGDPEVDALWSREYRPGWEPKV